MASVPQPDPTPGEMPPPIEPTGPGIDSPPPEFESPAPDYDAPDPGTQQIGFANPDPQS